MRKGQREDLRKRVLRGAGILQVLKDFQLMFKSGTDSVLKLSNDFQVGARSESELAKVNQILLEAQAIRSAYRKIVGVYNDYFEIELISEENFRKKHFKGYRILCVIDSLNFMIKNCEQIIIDFESISTSNSSDFITYYEKKILVYQDFRNVLDKIFVQKDINPDKDARIELDFPSISTWISHFNIGGHFK